MASPQTKTKIEQMDTLHFKEWIRTQTEKIMAKRRKERSKK